jgi:hypothetical protein
VGAAEGGAEAGVDDALVEFDAGLEAGVQLEGVAGFDGADVLN